MVGEGLCDTIDVSVRSIYGSYTKTSSGSFVAYARVTLPQSRVDLTNHTHHSAWSAHDLGKQKATCGAIHAPQECKSFCRLNNFRFPGPLVGVVHISNGYIPAPHHQIRKRSDEVHNLGITNKKNKVAIRKRLVIILIAVESTISFNIKTECSQTARSESRIKPYSARSHAFDFSLREKNHFEVEIAYISSAE